MSVRVAVRPLCDADAVAVWHSETDTHVFLIADRLTPGQQLVIGAHLAERLDGAAPDAGVHVGVGEVTAMSPNIARRELVDLMDQGPLSIDDYAALAHYLFPADPFPSERTRPWPTSGPRR